MGTQLEQAPAVREFATAIGEWLLTQRFGSITPLAFRYRVWEPEPHDPIMGDMPMLVMDVLVNDPPPPPPEWHRLKDMKSDDMTMAEYGEWMRGVLWPRTDMDAIDEAVDARARTLGFPEGLSYWPVVVNLFGRSDARECGFPSVDD